MSHLSVCIRAVDGNLDVTEELLDMVPMTKPTSENDLGLQLRKV